jgi:GDP-L-fucose synthase
MIRHVVGFSGALSYDRSKPDGTPRKVLDVSTLQDLGWRSTTPLQAGLVRTYIWFSARIADEAAPAAASA